MDDRVNGWTGLSGSSGGSSVATASSTGPTPGVAVGLGGVGASLSSTADAGGTVQVQLTGVLALILLAVVVFAAHKLM